MTHDQALKIESRAKQLGHHPTVSPYSLRRLNYTVWECYIRFTDGRSPVSCIDYEHALSLLAHQLPIPSLPPMSDDPT